ncbi:MAG: hypothetical protein HY096_07375 [Nitrospinae bacterium]|nr:hypothetical protein [Nitrospinota bacterium]
MKQQNLLRRFTYFVMIILAALLIVFEEWVWDSILAVMARFGRLRLIHRFEEFIAKQHQYLLLVFFCFPFFIMMPAKLYGLYLIADGKVAKGVTIFILAKGLITALVTRLFVISKDKLLLIKVFAVSYHWLIEKKEWVYAELNQLPAWQVTKRKVAEIKQHCKSIVRLIREVSLQAHKLIKDFTF